MPYVDTNDVFCRYRLPISQWTTAVYRTEYTNKKKCMFLLQKFNCFLIDLQNCSIICDEMMKLKDWLFM